jgi:hypothetical protein
LFYEYLAILGNQLLSNPLKSLHAAHAGAGYPDQVFDLATFSNQLILRINHVGDGEFRKIWTKA